MRIHLPPNDSCVGVEATFSGNFTKAKYLRGQSAEELERRLGYGSGRLASGWWLLFAQERPDPANFEFGGYTHFSGSRIGDPRLGAGRPHVEEELAANVGGKAGVDSLKKDHVAGLDLTGPDRLAKVIPVAGGTHYPVGSGIYQCNIPKPINCRVVAFVAPGGTWQGTYA